jgi:hypothetical protein
METAFASILTLDLYDDNKHHVWTTVECNDMIFLGLSLTVYVEVEVVVIMSVTAGPTSVTVSGLSTEN